MFSSGRRTTFAKNLYGYGPTFGEKAGSLPNSSAYAQTKSPLLSARFRERALIPVPLIRRAPSFRPPRRISGGRVGYLEPRPADVVIYTQRESD
jgi:hypothetical protein